MASAYFGNSYLIKSKEEYIFSADRDHLLITGWAPSSRVAASILPRLRVVRVKFQVTGYLIFKISLDFKCKKYMTPLLFDFEEWA